MNFFTDKSAAQRYARSRPYFHPVVIDKIKHRLHLEEPVERAVDIGCGAGQSTVALKTIAKAIVGVDISAAMLQEAPRDPAIRYVQAPAEETGLATAAFDLMTISLAFHWFDQERFLAEARRLLKEGGWLIIYNNGFSGQMHENPAFARWSKERYPVRYPTPPRNVATLTPEQAQRFGFSFAHQEDYQNDVRFTPEELAAYLTTQSNVIARVEQGEEDVVDVEHWLLAEIRPLFLVSPATFLFGGFIWSLQKVG